MSIWGANQVVSVNQESEDSNILVDATIDSLVFVVMAVALLFFAPLYAKRCLFVALGSFVGGLVIKVTKNYGSDQMSHMITKIQRMEQRFFPLLQLSTLIPTLALPSPLKALRPICGFAFGVSYSLSLARRDRETESTKYISKRTAENRV